MAALLRGDLLAVGPATSTVDIDRYIARNQPTWERLDDLTARARHKVADLDQTMRTEVFRLIREWFEKSGVLIAK